MRTFLFACVLAARVAAQEHDAPARALYLKHCAQCHGESGDGNGVTKLEKPARSFQDGGFGYGNTPEALFRTLTFGIPGTPMPSFSSALTEAERKELAAYVVTLGPPVVEVARSETLLVVKDVPLFVRGKLPPIVEGAPEIARGLLVGTPDGFTFEYAVDDVRLLGVRQGAFVERKDWSGRGGDALEPLGKLFLRCDMPTIGGAFHWIPPVRRSTATRIAKTRFVGTRVVDSTAHVASRIELEGSFRDEDRASAPTPVSLAVDVDESVRAIANELGAGFRREITLELARTSATKDGGIDWVFFRSEDFAQVRMDIRWVVVQLKDGRWMVAKLARESAGSMGAGTSHLVVTSLPLEPRAARRVVLDVYVLPVWNADVEAAWKAELAR